MIWSSIIDDLEISEDDLSYLMSRGCKYDNINLLKIRTWDSNRVIHNLPNDFRKFIKNNFGLIDGKIVIPMFGTTGKIIGLEFRGAENKFIFEYRTEESKWTPCVVGLNKYLPLLMAGNPVWLVEGIFDLFALEWSLMGNHCVLATVRANLTKNTARMLSRFGNRVYICYDNDSAGTRATVAAVSTLRKFGVEGMVFKYGSYKDPGEVWDIGGQELVKRVFR